MIALQDSYTELEHLKTVIEKKINYTYLNQYIQKPVIDDEKLFMLKMILEHVQLPYFKKERYMLTAMLIQMALDIHDLVLDHEEDAADSVDTMQKQLNVLAGDYYSGLYYLLLSEIDDFKLIQTLASAIKQINESKMKLYYHDFQSFDDFLALIKEKESQLFVHIANYVHEPWLISFIEEWLLTNALMNEKTMLKQGKSLFGELWLKRSPTFHLASIEREIDAKIKQQKTRTKELLAGLPNHYNKAKSHYHPLLI